MTTGEPAAPECHEELPAAGPPKALLLRQGRLHSLSNAQPALLTRRNTPQAWTGEAS